MLGLSTGTGGGLRTAQARAPDTDGASEGLREGLRLAEVVRIDLAGRKHRERDVARALGCTQSNPTQRRGHARVSRRHAASAHTTTHSQCGRRLLRTELLVQPHRNRSLARARLAGKQARAARHFALLDELPHHTRRLARIQLADHALRVLQTKRVS